MMQLFYIDWQQHWKYDRTMNIGANAHGKRAVSTKQPQVTDLTSVDSWASSDIGEVLSYWASFTSPWTVSQCDCLTVRPFFAATYRHRENFFTFTGLEDRKPHGKYKFYWSPVKDQRPVDFPMSVHMYMYLLFETSPGWLPGWRSFF